MGKKKKIERSKDKKKKNKEQVVKIYSQIQAVLDEQAGKGITFKQIVKKLGIKQKEDIKKAGYFLDDLVEEGKIKQLENGSYVGERSSDEYQGIVDHVNSR